MKQNPCRYCALSWENKGKHFYSSFDEHCAKCENIKKHREYLKSQRKFEIGQVISDFGELMKQEWVYVGMANSPSHIEVVKSWQVRSVLRILDNRRFHKAIRKESEDK
jgi:hypothetical protein